MILMRQGATQEAISAFDEGLEMARALGLPYVEARLLVQMGLLEERGNPEGARARWEEALLIFRRLGAKKDLEQTEETLRQFA
jgi:tetratricopeptide (TPR) repeat protein